ncbi:uncharacterized protein N7483_007975 [Penicillium malachiteum]|uniref:uncharacterized protein n=1 Tax=Penicillium malachiteum TaxID=1324776 RepID=UPI0025472F44|nr:uncharacterized protein N7483_007975 [Penicillium malachiteum]KAJ5726618.1 hypothetical protein N7483_007975 [Penicillium malachiteum]
MFQPDEVISLPHLPRVDKRWSSLLRAFNIHGTSISGVRKVNFSADAKLAAVIYHDEMEIWDVESETSRHHFWNHVVSQFMEFSPDNSKLAASISYYWDEDGNDTGHAVQLWDTSTGILEYELEGLPMNNQVFFSPNGMLLASISLHGYNLWDVTSGSLLHSFRSVNIGDHHEREFSNLLSFSSNNELIAYSSGNQVFYIDAISGNPKFTLLGHTQEVCDVAFSHAGKLIASASQDEIINLWNSSTGILQHTFKYSDEHTESNENAIHNKHSPNEKAIHSLAFSPNDSIVASSSGVTVKVWDTIEGNLQYTLSMVESNARAVAFSPDGRLSAVQL